jgi:pre-mRNA-splicing factor ATP-dependent RNA helicase DHX15/PRP43
VRAQLSRNMERFEIELMSITDPRKLYIAVRMALVCGYFMQVAHREGEKGNYLTVKDNQVVGLHPSCGMDGQPEWVIFNEFVLTTRPYIRTVTEIKPEWCVRVDFVANSRAYLVLPRLLEYSNSYFDLTSFPDGETKRALTKVANKKAGKAPGRGGDGAERETKRKRVK